MARWQKIEKSLAIEILKKHGTFLVASDVSTDFVKSYEDHLCDSSMNNYPILFLC